MKKWFLILALFLFPALVFAQIDKCGNKCGAKADCAETIKGDWVCIKDKTPPDLKPTVRDAFEEAQVLIYRGQNLRFPGRYVMGMKEFVFYGIIFGVCFILGLILRWKKRYFSIPMNILLSLYITSTVLLYDELQGMFNYYIIGRGGILAASHLIFTLLAYGTLFYVIFAFIHHWFKLREGELTPLMTRFVMFIDKYKTKFNL